MPLETIPLKNAVEKLVSKHECYMYVKTCLDIERTFLKTRQSVDQQCMLPHLLLDSRLCFLMSRLYQYEQSLVPIKTIIYTSIVFIMLFCNCNHHFKLVSNCELSISSIYSTMRHSGAINFQIKPGNKNSCNTSRPSQENMMDYDEFWEQKKPL